MVLVVKVRGDRALLRAGGSARQRDVRALTDYVLATATWSPTGGGWVIPAAAVPDVRAGAEIRHWVVRDVA